MKFESPICTFLFCSSLVLFEADDLNVVFFFLQVVQVQRGEKHVLVAPGILGKLHDEVEGCPPVDGVHEDVKLVENPEGRVHVLPQAQDQRHRAVALLAPRQGLDVADPILRTLCATQVINRVIKMLLC